MLHSAQIKNNGDQIVVYRVTYEKSMNLLIWFWDKNLCVTHYFYLLKKLLIKQPYWDLAFILVTLQSVMMKKNRSSTTSFEKTKEEKK